MLITANEFKLNPSKFLDLVVNEDILITENDKLVAKLTKPDVSSVNYLSGILQGKVPQDIDKHSIREERLSNCKMVKVKVTLPLWLLKASQEAHIDLSQTLQEALIRKLGIRREIKRRKRQVKKSA